MHCSTHVFRCDKLSLNLHTTPFDLGGIAKSRNFDHVRAHRRRAHESLALPFSQVHRFVHDLQISHFAMAELVELRMRVPQNERVYAPLVCTTLHRQAQDWAF